MKWIILSGLGSMIGGMSRYAISLGFRSYIPGVLPAATLTANLAGCFIIGFLFALFEKMPVSEGVKIFLIPGVLGGFTTFSAFSVETIELFSTGYQGKALLYVLISVAGGLLATFAGFVIIKN